MAIDDPKVTATSMTLPGGDSALLFDTAVRFQNTEIGRLYLGMSRAGMEGVARSTLFAMSMLGVLAALAAAGMCFIFGDALARSMRLVRNSLMSFGAGDFERRISEKRNDEIGELFTAFNHMADCLQSGRAQQDGNGALAAMLPVPDRARLLAVAAAADAEATLMLRSDMDLPELEETPGPESESEVKPAEEPEELPADSEPPERSRRARGSRKRA